MVRTTVRLDEHLFKEARKKAIDERVAFTDIVNDALHLYLKGNKKGKTKKVSTNDFLSKLATFKLKGGPKDLAQNHDKYTWE